jgi:hypothetical protein
MIDFFFIKIKFVFIFLKRTIVVVRCTTFKMLMFEKKEKTQ